MHNARFESSREPSSVRFSLTLIFFLVFITTTSFSQGGNNFVNDLTVVPVPGVGHDYIHDLSEIVNPANGALSIRIEAPRPKERGLNYPFYAFVYDSTQQFTFQYQESTNGSSYACGNDSEGDNADAGEPTQPLNCILSVSFPYQSIVQNTQFLLSGPNSMLSPLQLFGRDVGEVQQYWTCNAYGPFSYEDPYGVIHDLGVYSLPNWSPTGACPYLGVSDSPIGGDEEYKIVTVDNYSNIPFSGMIDAHGNSFSVLPNGTSSPTMEDTNGNAVDGTGRTGTYQSFQPWGDALKKPPTPSRTFAGGATYKYTWGTAKTSFSPASVDETVAQVGYDNLCAGPSAPKFGFLGNVTSNTVVAKIQEPDNLYYTFTYDPTYGLLSQITYPTGAWVKYTWGINSLSDATGWSNPSYTDAIYFPPSGPTMNTFCIFKHDTPAITKRVVSFDGTTSALEQDFSYSTNWGTSSAYGEWSSKQTIVTTKDLLSAGSPSFKTIYNYSPILPDSLLGSHLFSSQLPVESSISYQDTAGHVLRTVTKTWNAYNQLAGECTTLPNGKTEGTFYQYAPYPIESQGSIANPRAKTTTVRTDIAEYDYGLVTVPCQRPSTTPTRETVTTYASFSNTPLWPSFTMGSTNISMPPMIDRPATVITYSNGTKASETDYKYDETAVSAVLPTPIGHDETNYGNKSTVPRGNPTTITHKCFQGTTNCTDSVTRIVYDTTGQPVSVTDPNGNQTTLSYTDNYTTDDGSPSGNTNTYLTTITRPPTNGIPHVEQFQWDFNKGELRTLTDENLQQTLYQYNDPWWRLTQASFPDSGSITKMYDDAGPKPTLTTNTLVTSGLTMTSESIMDAVGHVITSQLTSDPEGTDQTVTTYDGLGRVSSVTNPYRATTDATYGVTAYSYDSLGRKTKQAQPDGSILQWCYDNVPSGGQTNCLANASTASADTWVDFSDEIGNHWQRTYDALGRMTSAMEPNGATSAPSMETDYQYDGLDNVISVVQNGNNSANARTRSFSYDSLSRLTSATNPEGGAIAYSYDANGNLITRAAPSPNQAPTGNSVTTTYSYDALNRLTGKSYADSYAGNSVTPPVQYGYDGVALTGCTTTPPTITDSNPVGYRSSMCDPSGATSWSHDVMGRILKDKHDILALGTDNIFPVSYTYNLDGSLATLTYPSSARVITYTPGGAGRPLAAQDITDNVNYVQNATYAAFGGLTGMSQGTAPITLTNSYNSRLQPVLISAATTSSLLSLCYNFHSGAAISSGPCTFQASTSGDNGNIFKILNNRDTTRTQNFTYDSLNRVATASSGSWNETYTIDAWGNLTNRSGNTTEPLNCPANNQNQLITCGYAYDLAGNMTNDTNTQYTYDGENRVVAAVNAGGTWSYRYDGDGRRVKKSVGSIGLLYWTGINDSAISETDFTGAIQKEYVFFNGKRAARYDPPTATYHYYLSDHLGSTSVMTGGAGVIQNESDYYPFGGEIVISSTEGNHYKFTGKERDGETGLDMFGARYYNSSFGRFMTPDWAAKPTAVPYAHFENPQSLNLYSYVENNPLSRVDFEGHDWVDKFKNLINYGHYAEGAELQKALQKEADQLRIQFVRQHVAVNGTLLTVPGLNKMANTEVLDLWSEYQFSNATGNTDEQASVGGVVYTSSQLGKTEIHHGLPRQFSRFFSDRGLDIEDYTMEVSAGSHRLGPDALHRGQGEENWNGAWRQWIANNPNATREQVLQQLNTMKAEFGLGGENGGEIAEEPVVPE